jgi:transcriptional regulator with XRE-family HTH domain
VNKIRDDAYLKAFGNNLRRVRLEKGLTMESLAFDAGIEYRQLGRIERGEVNTTISTVLALAKALDIEVSFLFQFRYRK